MVQRMKRAVIAILAGFLALVGCGPEEESADVREQVAATKIATLLHENTPPLATGESPVDGVRRWVTVNSIHEIDEEYYGYGGDIALILDRLRAHAEGNGQPPHLECSTRANALMQILSAQGHETRRAYLFSDAQPQLKSHVLLEVRRDGRWEIQDPDYGVYYIDRETGERVGTERLQREPLDRFMPCKAPDDCGWQHAEVLRTYFGAVGYKFQSGRPRVVVNTARFDMDKVYDSSETFADFIENDWGKGLAETETLP